MFFEQRVEAKLIFLTKMRWICLKNTRNATQICVSFICGHLPLAASTRHRSFYVSESLTRQDKTQAGQPPSSSKSFVFYFYHTDNRHCVAHMPSTERPLTAMPINANAPQLRVMESPLKSMFNWVKSESTWLDPKQNNQWNMWSGDHHPFEMWLLEGYLREDGDMILDLLNPASILLQDLATVYVQR